MQHDIVSKVFRVAELILSNYLRLKKSIYVFFRKLVLIYRKLKGHAEPPILYISRAVTKKLEDTFFCVEFDEEYNFCLKSFLLQ